MAKPVGPYSTFAEAGNLVYTSGQIGIDDDGVLVTDDLQGQAKQALANIREVLQAAGLDMKDVVKSTVFVTDVSMFKEINVIYAEAFGDHKPARSVVGVAALPLGAKFEIEAVAKRG